MLWLSKGKDTAPGAAVQAAHRARQGRCGGIECNLDDDVGTVAEQTLGFPPALPDEVESAASVDAKPPATSSDRDLQPRSRVDFDAARAPCRFSDETERALGLTYRARINEARPIATWQAPINACSNACDESETCLAEASAAGERAAVDDRQRWRASRLRPAIPRVCTRKLGCSSDAMRRRRVVAWRRAMAQLDPDNGAPWYPIAGKPRRGKTF